jgi:hypothetical protein
MGRGHHESGCKITVPYRCLPARFCGAMTGLADETSGWWQSCVWLSDLCALPPVDDDDAMKTDSAAIHTGGQTLVHARLGPVRASAASALFCASRCCCCTASAARPVEAVSSNPEDPECFPAARNDSRSLHPRPNSESGSPKWALQTALIIAVIMQLLRRIFFAQWFSHRQHHLNLNTSPVQQVGRPGLASFD